MTSPSSPAASPPPFGQAVSLIAPQWTLPPHARADLAFVWTVTGSDADTTVIGDTFLHITPGRYIEIPLAVTLTHTTNATVADRLVILQAKDDLANVLWRIPASATQAQGTTYNYSWLPGSFQGTPAGTALVAPLIQTPQVAGYQLQLAVAAGQAGDTVSALALTLLRVPTGPPLAAVVQPVPTPLLT